MRFSHLGHIDFLYIYFIWVWYNVSMIQQTNLYTLKDNDLILEEGDVRKYVLKIRDLPNEDKPREKLLKHGPDLLSVKELLAVVLNTGTKKEGVLEMVDRISREYGEKSLAYQKDAKKFAEDLDIPVGKATQIVACFELGRRFYDKKENGLITLRSAKDVYDYLSDMRNLPKENLRGIYLNTHHKVIHDEVISIGTLNSNLIHPREVFRPAIEHGAAAVILAHNHPSGVVAPSDADVEITKKIVATGKIIGIDLIDHVIIGKDKFESIKVNYD